MLPFDMADGGSPIKFDRYLGDCRARDPAGEARGRRSSIDAREASIENHARHLIFSEKTRTGSAGTFWRMLSAAAFPIASRHIGPLCTGLRCTESRHLSTVWIIKWTWRLQTCTPPDATTWTELSEGSAEECRN